MDSVIKVRRSFLNDVRGFCNGFAGMCDGCFRRPCNCEMSDIIHRAKNLIFRIDNIRDADEERFFVENPNEEIFARVIRAIEQAGRPVKSKEIRLNGVYRQKKAWVLKHMLKRGMIEMSLINRTPFYSVGVYGTKRQNTTQNTNQ